MRSLDPPLDPDHRAIVEDLGLLVDRAALDPAGWSAVLDEACRRLDGTKVAMQLFDARAMRGLPLLASGFDPSVIDAYARRYGAINPWAPVMAGSACLQVMDSEVVRPAASFRDTEFYTDWLSRGGGIDAAVGTKLIDGDGRLAVLSVHFDARQAAATRALVVPVLRQLGPRLRRALVANQAGAALEWAEGRPFLDSLGNPAFVVAHDLRLVEANAPGEALIEQGDLVQLGRRDALRFPDAEFGQAFAALVATAVGGAAPAGDGVARVATRRGRRLLIAHTLNPDLLRLAGLDRLWLPNRLALIVVRADEGGEFDLVAILSRSHDLSVPEARLAAALANGDSLVRAAEALDLNYETARSRLKRIFIKLDLRRQSELVAYVARLNR